MCEVPARMRRSSAFKSAGVENGALRCMLHVKNAMGCTPLDVAHVFGPFPETEALLIQAVLGDEFDARYV